MTNNQRKRFYRNKYKILGDHNNFLERISKSLYYGRLPKLPCLSLPVTELSSEMFSEAHKGKSLKRLHMEDAAELSRSACVSPCSLVLALLYLERLKNTNLEYVSKMAPSELFLVTLMVSNKFLQDDGEEDEVFCSEWAFSGGMTTQDLHQLEWEFLDAIDWRVYIGEQSFESGLRWLEHQVAIRQAKLRGWLTYSDVANIKTTFDNISLLKCLMTVYLALSLSYLASVLTLVASTYIVSQGTSLVNDCNSIASKLHHNHLYNIDDTANHTVHKIIKSPILDNPNAFIDISTESHSEIYYSNKTIDFRIQSYLPTTWSLLHSHTVTSIWQALFESDIYKFISNFLSKYFSTDYHINVDSTLSLNDIYLNIRQPSTSWYHREGFSLAWQYPGSVRY